MQVITPENHVEFITTGKVADFKPPLAEPAKTDATDTTKQTPATGAPDAKADAAKSSETPRASDGKFVKAGDTPADASAKADADDDVKLTERISRLINKKHREMKEAQEFGTTEGRRAIAAEQRAEQLQREIDALKGTKSGGPNTDEAGSDPDEPKPGDFKTVGEYTRALVKYEAKRAGESGKAQADQTKQQERATELVSAFAKRQDEFKAATSDYEDVVGSTDLIVPNIAMQYLVESELGPQLSYYLAKNPDEAARLRTLSPSRCLAELGKMETKLEKPATPTPKVDAGKPAEVSKAPAPITPLAGKEASVTKDPKDMNFQELRALRQQEARAKAGR